MEDAVIDTLFAAMPVLVIGGLIAHGLALWRLRGGWRLAAWVPAGAMGAALAVGVLDGLAGSNVAPIWIVLALPFCLLWLAGLWLLRGLAALVGD